MHKPQVVDGRALWGPLLAFRTKGYFGVSGRCCRPRRGSDARIFSRNGSKMAFLGVTCGGCYLDSMVARYVVRLSWSLPFDGRSRRVLRCFSAHAGQRVCSGMAGCWQSLHKPCSLRLLRFSAVRARACSCRSSDVRRTRFGFSDAFGFATRAVAGFEALRARVGAGFGLAGFLVLRLGSGLSS